MLAITRWVKLFNGLDFRKVDILAVTAKGETLDLGGGKCLDVGRHPLLDGSESVIATGRPQRTQVGLGVALVLATKRVGKRDVVDQAGADCIGQGQRRVMAGLA